MRTRHFLPTLLLLSFAQAVHALDFKLQELRVKNLDGELVDLYFAHDADRIFYRPPPNWTWSGSAARFEATPPPPRSGKLIISTFKPVADAGAPGVFEQKDAFAKIALKSLPPTAESPQVLEVTLEKLGGRELPCTRVTIAYRLSVQERVVTISYAAFRPNLWLQISLDAAKVDFARANGEALHSLEAFTEVPAEKPTASVP